MDPRGPTASVVTVGTELCLGEVTDENGPWLCAALTRLGIEVVARVTLPDDMRRIAGCVRRERAGSDLVLVSGGLGGTPDDVTRAAIARAFDVEVRTDTVLAASLRTAHDYTAEFAEIWSRMPAGARPVFGTRGGAPGLRLENVIALPGVPAEMRAMFAVVAEGLGRGPVLHTWRRTLPVGEHRLLPCLEELELLHAGVAAGSYPRFGPEGAGVEIVLRTTDRDALDRAVAVVERFARVPT